MEKRYIFWENQKDIRRLAYSLHSDYISVCTTDTVIGLLAKTSKESFLKINEIKGRVKKPYIVLVSDSYMVHQLAYISLKIQKIIDQHWPGPLTLILNAKEDIPEFLCSSAGTIAIRIPKHKGLLTLMQIMQTPLFSTSANQSEKAIPKSIFQIEEKIIQKIDLIMCGKKETHSSLIPSTILDCTNSYEIKCVRKGAISFNLI